MYSWGDDMSDWNRPGAYRYDDARAAQRAQDAAQAGGRRTYERRSSPVVAITDAKKRIASRSANPLIVATDVTGSMQQWPFEIFDRLPLLYQTLSQYREDLEVAFMTVGDANVNRFPLQVTDFTRGFALEEKLGGLYGEGGGSTADPSESYGLLAYYALNLVDIPDTKEKPFFIVFGDVSMQPEVKKAHVERLMGRTEKKDLDAVKLWQKLAKVWNIWFLHRPGRLPQATVDAQWSKAIGAQKHLHIHDEKRAVDYAMGLVARHWGQFGDFQQNMRARQDDRTVDAVSNTLDSIPSSP